MIGIFGEFFGQMKLNVFSPRKAKRIEPYDLIRRFGCKCFRKSSNSGRLSKTRVPTPKLNAQLCRKKSVNIGYENKTAFTS